MDFHGTALTIAMAFETESSIALRAIVEAIKDDHLIVSKSLSDTAIIAIATPIPKKPLPPSPASVAAMVIILRKA